MRIAVWEHDDERWSTVAAACSTCASKPERLPVQRRPCAADLSRFDAAIIALRDPDDSADESLQVAGDFRAAGVCVVAHGSSASTWPISAKCRALLAGAKHLLDSEASEFAAELEATLRVALHSLSEERDGELRVRELARNNGIVGQSASLLNAFRQVVRVSKLSDLPVLITGESGTGKELFASAIHALDPKRSAREIVAVNCAAIHSGVAESELFGHQRGAFTGAARDHGGLFLAAQGGVLFLDEIGELSLDLQAKILRVLQEKRVRRLGAGPEMEVDVRIIAATNQNLQQMIRDGKFRNDLFHRLNALSIHVDPLRERRDDIAALAAYFVDSNRSWKKISGLDAEFVSALTHLNMPGNVRELKNLITNALAAKSDDAPLGLKDLPANAWLELLQSNFAGAAITARTITRASLADESISIPPLPSNNDEEWNLDDYLLQCERKLVIAAMEKVKHNQTQAARLLGLTPRSVYNKLRKHQLLD